MKYLLAIFTLFLLASCGIRKVSKQNLEQVDKSKLEVSVKETSRLKIVGADNTKTQVSATDKSKVFENENTEITADEAEVDMVNGKLHLKGNVNVKSKKQKAIHNDRQSQSNAERELVSKVSESKSRADQAKHQNVSKIEADSKSTEAKSSFVGYWWLWLIIALAIGIIVKKWLL